MPVTVIINSYSLTVTVTGGPGNPRDFVGIYRQDTGLDQYLVWKYLASDKTSPVPPHGVATGTVRLALDNPTGLYIVYFVAVAVSGTMTLVGQSGPFNFGPWPIGVGFSAPPGIVPTGPHSWTITTSDNDRLDIDA